MENKNKKITQIQNIINNIPSLLWQFITGAFWGYIIISLCLAIGLPGIVGFLIFYMLSNKNII